MATITNFSSYANNSKIKEVKDKIKSYQFNMDSSLEEELSAKLANIKEINPMLISRALKAIVDERIKRNQK